MSAISASVISGNHFLSSRHSRPNLFPPSYPPRVSNFTHFSLHRLCYFRRKTSAVVSIKASSEEEAEGLTSTEEDEWLKRLPDKKKPLYSHSLPCIEAWLRELGFYQSNEGRSIWLIEKTEWHAQLSLDITDLFIRYLKSGPGTLEKDMERRFSYALSREDIENAILGGP